MWCVGTSPPKIQILGPLIEVRVMFIGGSKNKKQKRSENSVVAHTPSSEELTSYFLLNEKLELIQRRLRVTLKAVGHFYGTPSAERKVLRRMTTI